MEETREVPKGRTAERILSQWLEARQRIRSLVAKLRDAQEEARTLERDHPWLGGIKGTLRKKDGISFDIPEGPKVAKAAPPGDQQPAPGPSGEAGPSQPKPDTGRKRKAAPLMEKARKDAAAKRKKLHPPPAALTPPPTLRRVTHLRDLSEVPVQLLREALAHREEPRRDSWESVTTGGEEEDSRMGSDSL
jgi:hypothetical protein